MLVHLLASSVVVSCLQLPPECMLTARAVDVTSAYGSHLGDPRQTRPGPRCMPSKANISSRLRLETQCRRMCSEFSSSPRLQGSRRSECTATLSMMYRLNCWVAVMASCRDSGLSGHHTALLPTGIFATLETVQGQQTSLCPGIPGMQPQLVVFMRTNVLIGNTLRYNMLPITIARVIPAETLGTLASRPCH